MLPTRACGISMPNDAGAVTWQLPCNPRQKNPQTSRPQGAVVDTPIEAPQALLKRWKVKGGKSRRKEPSTPSYFRGGQRRNRPEERQTQGS